jgi:hypothetical protein
MHGKRPDSHRRSGGFARRLQQAFNPRDITPGQHGPSETGANRRERMTARKTA